MFGITGTSINIIIIAFTVLMLVFSTLLYRRAAGTLDVTRLNPVGATYYFYLFLSLFGTTLVLLGTDQHHMLSFIRHDQTKWLAWLSVLLLMLIFPLVVIMLNRLTHYDPHCFADYCQKSINPIKRQADFIVVLGASLICIASVFYVYYIIGIRDNPILNLIAGVDSTTLNQLRIQAGAQFPGNIYIKNIIAKGITPFISMIAFVYMRKTKERKWIILFVIMFIVSNLMAVYDLSKAPIVVYWITFLFVCLYYGDRVRLRHVGILGLFGAGAIGSMYYFIYNRPLTFILSFNGPINRLLMTTPMAFLLHLEVYAYRFPLLNGASLPAFIGSTLFGQETVIRSARQVMQAVNYEGIRTGEAGVYNGLFLGEAFANFGIWGLLFSIVHVAALFFVLTYAITRIEKSPITISLFAILTVNLLMTLNGGYADYIFNTMWFILIVTAGLLKLAMVILGFFERKIRSRTPKTQPVDDVVTPPEEKSPTTPIHASEDDEIQRWEDIDS